MYWNNFYVSNNCSLAENVDNPSPLALTQIGCEARVEPIDEFLKNTRRSTLQCLRDAGSVSCFISKVKFLILLLVLGMIILHY
jgi:hypothetical protein